MLNLLLNSLDAIEAKPEGVRRLEIRVCAVAGGMAEIAVTDTEAGVDPERLPRLFEPFFTTKAKGAGIGLTISKTIIESHGGRISVRNNPDGGTTVRFTLPLVNGEVTS